VEVVLESPATQKSHTEQRQTLSPTEAFARYLADNGAADPEVEALFAELLDEAMSGVTA
jgi:hypothetical protein